MKTTTIYLYDINDRPFFTSININHETEQELDVIVHQIADIEEVDDIEYR